MKYRMQLFLVFSLVFLAVLSEAKDKKKGKGDTKLKAKALELNVTNQDWPEPSEKVKDWLLDADHTKFLDKWQPLSNSEAKKLGPISKNNFSSEGVCSKRYKCETITYGSSANIDKDIKNPAKSLKPISMKNMDKFLEHLKKRKPIKLTHHIQKDSLMAAEVHHSGVVIRITERNGKEVSGEHAAALAFDSYKYIIMNSEPQAVRVMVAQTNDKPLVERSLCIFPKGANRAQADNYCRGKDADPDEEDEKEAKDKKKDEEDSCSADDKKSKSVLKDTSNKLLELLKSMLGIKSDDSKDAKKVSKKGKSDKKCKSNKKEDKKDKKEKKKANSKKGEKKDDKKNEKKGDEKDDDKDEKDSAGFQLEQVIIKVAPKKSSEAKGDSDKDFEADGAEDSSSKKANSAKEKKQKSKSTIEDSETDELDMENIFGQDDTSSKKDVKADKKEKSAAKKTSSKKAEKPKAKKSKAESDDEDDEDDSEDTSKPKSAKKKKADSFKQKSISKKVAQKKASLKKAAKKQVAKLKKAIDGEDDDIEAVFEDDEKSASKKNSASKKKDASKKDGKKKDKPKKDGKKGSSKKTDDDAVEPAAEKADRKLWTRSAEPEGTYFGGESMDHLYGRSNSLQYGQYPRQSQLNALRRRQQILRGAALARRALNFEDNELIARARIIREPLERREAEPEPEPEAEAEAFPEPEAEPVAEPMPEPEAEAEAEATPQPEEKGGYLFSRAFFDDVETLLAGRSPEFHEETQSLLERSLGLDEAEEYYEW